MTKYFIHIFIFIILSISSLFAETFEVEMLNKHDGQINVFNPPIVRVAVGDTVNWTSVNPGHNIAFTKKGVPDGVEKFKSKIGKDATFTFTIPGVYAYNCTPHYGLGMIGFVVVGDDTSNLEAIEKIKYPGKAKAIAKELIEQLK